MHTVTYADLDDEMRRHLNVWHGKHLCRVWIEYMRILGDSLGEPRCRAIWAQAPISADEFEWLVKTVRCPGAAAAATEPKIYWGLTDRSNYAKGDE